MEYRSDYLVLGSGLAGMVFALKAARTGTVHLVTKRTLDQAATDWAQGGIASVWSETDSFESHIADTLAAGAGLSDPKVVERVVCAGPARVQELIDWGVQFSRSDRDEFDLGREGGHSRRRVLHATDMTGHAIQMALMARLKENPNIRIFENHFGVDLITSQRLDRRQGRRSGSRSICYGSYVLNDATGEVDTFLSRTTAIGTGGAGKVYVYTSNPDTATGDGIAMAWRAGCRVANMEFMQFHPTCLYHPKAKSFLVSEALRGEGAILRLADGTPFMERYHPMKDLAPRDVVSQAIDREMKRTGDDCVYLDITHKSAEWLKERFPNIYERCLLYGIDMAVAPVPVVPAAHYTCGGIMTGMTGETDVAGLYAIGEAAYTGLHGANRLASNSLLECAVFAHWASEHAALTYGPGSDFQLPERTIPPWDPGRATEPDELVVVTHNWNEVRRFMWDYVGIVRTNRRLERARRRADNLIGEINGFYWDFKVTPDLLELRNLSRVAMLIIQSARARKESRGLHSTLDYPDRNDEAFGRPTILYP
ncbi:MAG: L-aspartate oxidase [Deltaproteobacteria bacterium]|nr:L-aspartate oxidase [Deltaproteobacteria bacterium]